jgi:enoyl-CoA hydratase/carnithine racemase
MEYTQIQCQTSGQILTLTLNRPEKLNAFNSLMCKEIVDALVRADKDDDIKAIIVTGAGRAFCSGLDLSPESRNAAWRIDTSATQDMGANRDPVGVITLTIYDMITPVIAAINGPAIGAGITMTLSMDIRLASENAVIGFPFTRRGLTNEGASSWFLPRLVGMGKAMEWIITGRLIPAGEALSYGLINELVSPDDLLARAFTIARDIAENTSAVSVALCRQLLWKMHSAAHPMDVHKIDSKTLLWSFEQEDIQEGINSFMEKRTPHFPMTPGHDLPDFYPWWGKRKFNE